MLDLRPALHVRALAAEVLYEAADPFSRKVFIDRGATHGVALGAPVINEAGVLGQVTRVYPLSSEVTLLTDKDAAIPVLNARTQQRSAAFGGAGGGAMELRFMSANADVQVGDLLRTSGVDGVYPPGLPVARVIGRRAPRRVGLCAHPAGSPAPRPTACAMCWCSSRWRCSCRRAKRRRPKRPRRRSPGRPTARARAARR